jgi:hypothetical protein
MTQKQSDPTKVSRRPIFLGMFGDAKANLIKTEPPCPAPIEALSVGVPG